MILGNWPFFSFWPLTMASMMDGWSLPRLTKQCVMPASQMASKKAKDAVYLVRVSRCSVSERPVTYTMVPVALHGGSVQREGGRQADQCAGTSTTEGRVMSFLREPREQKYPTRRAPCLEMLHLRGGEGSWGHLGWPLLVARVWVGSRVATGFRLRQRMEPTVERCRLVDYSRRPHRMALGD